MWDILLIFVAIIGIILFWVMLYDSSRFVIVKHTVRDKRIKGHCRAVLLSDLHNKQYGKDNSMLLQAIHEQQPDIILVAGDILTAHPGKSLQPAIFFMERLAEKYPIFYGNGNHEQRIKLYPQTYGDMAEEYAGALQKMGVEPLVNTGRNVELPKTAPKQGIADRDETANRDETADRNETANRDDTTYGIKVYGVEIDKYYYKRFRVPFMEEGYLEGVLGKPDAREYTVLLAHNPDFFPRYAKWGADLVLSGHVHGGIVRIPGFKGVASPNIRFFPKYDGGVFEEGHSRMILSRGLGMHTIPIRLFNPAEVIVIDFEEED